MEGDPSKLIEEKAILIFQSTPSAWRETVFLYILIHRFGISIHSLRMEGDGRSGDIRLMLGISIHSLRMEGDYKAYTSP